MEMNALISVYFYHVNTINIEKKAFNNLFQKSVNVFCCKILFF